MNASQVIFQWSPCGFSRKFRSGVSLHSHTLHSKESLSFIYKASRHSSLLRWVLRRGESRYESVHGVRLDLNRGWWTPPLGPLEAHLAEADQIERLGMAPLVSLTDHDDIEAPMSLQATDPARQVPVSVEWTVPFGPTFFHLGVHNLPPDSARETMQTLREFTALPKRDQLWDLLRSLHETPGVLVVFNHPLWDEKGIGAGVHRAAALELLQDYGCFLHALEINGLRPWRENRDAISFAAECQKPVVSGGDRHAVEPNVVLNLTNAETFSTFAEEIRAGVSAVLITAQYRQAHFARILHNMADVLQPYENHGNGWCEWPDRVFYRCPDEVVRSLRQLWGEAGPASVRVFDSMMRLAAHPPVRSAVQAALATREEVVF